MLSKYFTKSISTLIMLIKHFLPIEKFSARAVRISYVLPNSLSKTIWLLAKTAQVHSSQEAQKNNWKIIENSFCENWKFIPFRVFWLCVFCVSVFLCFYALSCNFFFSLPPKIPSIRNGKRFNFGFNYIQKCIQWV